MKILLVVYDNKSFIPYFPMGMGYLASVLRNANHEVVVYSQDIYHYSDEHLTKYLDENEFDAVCLGSIAGYFQYRRMISLSEAINKSENRINFIFVIGGYMITPEPAYFLKKLNADIAVLGEGEETILEVMGTKLNNQVLGIAYMGKNGEVVVNPRRETIKDIDSIPMPAYDMFPMDIYKFLRFPSCEYNDYTATVLSGRGCKFRCNFCARLDDGFRPRSGENILKEIEYLQSHYGVNYIIFSDELMLSSEKRMLEMCELFKNSGLKFKWACEIRLNYAKLDILKLMKETGCTYVNAGIESFDNNMLKVMKKGLNTKMIVEGVENIMKANLSPGLNLIYGNIGETFEVLQKSVDFLLKYSDFVELRTIRPVTPYPGSPLYYHAIEKGLLKDVEDFYENKLKNSDLVSVNFTQYTDEEIHKELYEVNKKLISAFYESNKKTMFDNCYDLYYHLNDKFRGFRPVV